MASVWPRVKVSEVCESIVDCVNKTAKVVEHVTPYKMIRTTNVRDGYVNVSEVRHVDKDTYEKWTRRQVPQPGDVILTREAPLGEVGMIRTTEKIFLGQRLMSYRADDNKLDNHFLLYSLMSHDLQGQIRGLGSGATVEHMRVGDAENLELPLPPLETQRQIAAILSAYDDLIENNTRRIKVLEEMAGLIYREWFVNFRFPGHQGVRRVASELGEIPEGWRVINLLDIAEVTYGYAFKSKGFSNEPAGLPVVRIRDVLDGTSQTFTLEEATKKHEVENGDLLVGMDGDFHMGFWVGGKAYLVQRVARFRPREKVSMSLLFQALREPIKYFNATITGTTVAHLGHKHISTIKVILPSDELLEQANQLLEPLLNLQMSLRLKNQNLRRTRDLLLPKLISGELGVSQLGADPEDVQDLADLRAAKAVEGENPVLSLDELKLELERG